MSKYILLEEIKTLLEKIENLIDSGQFNERRPQIAAYGEELGKLKTKIETESFEVNEIKEHLNTIKASLKTI